MESTNGRHSSFHQAKSARARFARRRNGRRLFAERLEQRLLLTTVLSVEPLPNSHTAPVSADVTATFDQNINLATATAQNFVVHSTARPGQTIVTSSGTTVTADRSPEFFPGEVVQVTATSGILSTTSDPVVPRVWQFRTDSAAGTGIFNEAPQGLDGTTAASLGDVDGDGDLDAMVVVSVNGDNPLRVFENLGSGAFDDSGPNLTAGNGGFNDVSLGDLDGDGDLDAFGAKSTFGTPTGNGHRIWINDGSGQFTVTGQTLGNHHANSVTLGDLDGDGDLDAFMGANGPNRVWLNDGGQFTDSGQTLGNRQSYKVGLGDVDGDGDLDAIVANAGQPDGVWMNNGSGVFTDSGQTLGSNYGSFGVGLGDLDGDGDLDAFVTSRGDGSRIWLNDGAGGFTTDGQALQHGGAITGMSLGDLDGDGDLDAAINTRDAVIANQLWLNNGNGTFVNSGQDLGIRFGPIGGDNGVGDLDLDGDLDVFFAQAGGTSVRLNENRLNQVSLGVGTATAAEASATSLITATLSSTATDPVTVDLNVGGTATSNDDYTISAMQILIPAGASSGEVTITAVPDSLDEADETITIEITAVTGGEIAGGSQLVTVTILDDDDPPLVDLSVNVASVPESGGLATATATLSVISGQEVTVDLTADGSATAGTDYSLSATQLIIPTGETTAAVTVTSIDDPIDEPDETIELTISATNATVGVAAQTITVLDDDDPPTVTLSVDDESIEEDGGVATFTASLSAPAFAPVTVDLAVGGTATQSTDYTLSGTQVVILTGDTSGSVTVTSLRDLLITEGVETVTLEIATVSSNATEDGDQTATVTIIDDVNGPDVTLSIEPGTVSENGGMATVTATLGEAFTLPVTVDLGFSGAATFDTDYSTSANQLVVPVGETTSTITLTSLDDGLFEANEEVLVEIVNIINGDEAVEQQVAATILDDDDPPLVSLSVDPSAIAEDSGVATVTVTLAEPSGREATINLAYSGSAIQSVDYEVSATQLVIPAGEMTASLTVTALQDMGDDEQETIVVDIDSLIAAVEDGVQQQTVTITDDDLPEVTLDVDLPRIVEEVGMATLTAFLSSAATDPVTVDLAFNGTAEAGTDYVASGTQIVIPIGGSSGTVTLTAVPDTDSEPNETVLAEIVAVTNAQEVTPQLVEMMIEDDDGPPLVALAIDSDTIEEAGGVATVTATLARSVDVSVSVSLVFSGTAVASDYSLSDTQIAIPAGEISGSLTITALDDAIPEGDQTVVVDIESATGAFEDGTQQVTTTILDDEPQPTVSLLLRNPNPSIPENGGRAEVAAFLTGTTQSPVVIDLELTGTATPGQDYDGPTQITINPGGLHSIVFFNSINDALDEEDETVTVTATTISGAGGGGAVSFTIVDDDVVPEANLEIFEANILESGGRTTLRASLSSPALEDVTVELDYGTGSALLDEDFSGPTQLTILQGGRFVEATISAISDTLYEDDEEVIVEITSATGATVGGGQATTIITDDDPAPAVSLTAGAAEVVEGDVVSLTATLSAVSGRDVTVDLTFAGSATIETDYTTANQVVIPAGSDSAAIELTARPDLLDDPGETVTVNVAGVTNGTVAGDQQEITLTILNVAPPVVPDVTLSAAPAEITEEAGASTITATLSESTTMPVTVVLVVSASSTARTPDDFTVSGLEIAIAPGETSGSMTVSAVADEIDEPNETVTVEITSVTGGNELGQQSATVTIVDDDAPPTLQITSLIPTSGGFTAELSAEVDASVLNLYDAESADAGPSDIIVQGDTAGIVSGSLVVDPSRRRVSFVKSGGPLVSDNYTVTLVSGETAFKDAGGNLLDGDQDGNAGGDFSSSFTIAAADPIIVSLPDFVRGPGQEVHLPADTNTGIPLTISSGAGVRSATIHISYDSALLEITEASVGAAMPSGATVDLDTSTAGTAVITFVSSVDLPPEQNVLVNLQASVPTENAAANYGRQQVVDLHSVVVLDSSGNTIQVLVDDAVHLVSYFADVSGNGRINATDAAQVARVAALIDSGFAATLLTDPGIVGDISGNGRLNAADASLVAQQAALIDVLQIPVIPAAAVTAGSFGPALLNFDRAIATADSVPAAKAQAATSDDPVPSAPSSLVPQAVDQAVIDLVRQLSEADVSVELEESIEELNLSTRLSHPRP